MIHGCMTVEWGCGVIHTWLGVDEMASEPSALTPSQAQPLPKRLAAAALNLVFISSTEPKAASMASLTAPDGPLVLDGFVITCQRRANICEMRGSVKAWMGNVRRGRI